MPNEGRGDCAYIAVGIATADAVGGDLDAPNLKPGGVIQAQLRQWVAKEILSNPERYPVEGTHQKFTNSILKGATLNCDGECACGTSMLALTQHCRVELRV